MTWLPLPPGTDVGDLPAAPTPVGGVVTVAAVVVPWSTREQYAMTARLGAFAVTGRAPVTRGRVDYGITTNRGTFTIAGMVNTMRRGRLLAADAGALAATGNDATLTP